MNDDIFQFLEGEGVKRELLDSVRSFRKEHDPELAADNNPAKDRIPSPNTRFYGTEIWNQAIAALLCGENLLLAGPKATGKNILAENLAELFGRPLWNVSFHINATAQDLIGSDTYNGERVIFRDGPITQTAKKGGFAVLDEINMARNESLAVLHAVLDYRRIIDVPGYEPIAVSPAARFIATMNYGYAGTRDLNEALCSRFAILSMPMITEDNLRRLLRSTFPKIREEILGQFVKLFFEIADKAENAEISERALDLRGLLDAIRLMEMGIPSGDALTMCLTNKTFDSYERKLVQDVIDARIPGDLTKETIFES